MNYFIFSNGYKAEIDGVTLCLGRKKIHTIIETRYPRAGEVDYSFISVDGGTYSGRATTIEWESFHDWMSRYSVQLAPEPERNPALDLAGDYIVAGPEGLIPAKKNKPGCPECWDTGFWHGMGAPCSRGCRP